MTPVEIVAHAVHEQADDMSDCPYRLTANNPDVPTESCNRGCYDEPQCMTCTPSEGWPREELAKRYADLLPAEDDEPWGPSAAEVLDALSVLTALHEEDWRIVRTNPVHPGDRVQSIVAITDEWTP